MAELELTKALLTFVAAFAWPAAAVTIALVYRTQIRDVVERLQSGEVAGVKFSLAQRVAARVVRDAAEAIAQQPDASKRATLAQEVRAAADVVEGMHPRALAILITGAGGMVWVGGAAERLTRHFDYLQDSGYIKLEKSRGANDTPEVRIKYTWKGLELLRGIGFSDDELFHTERHLRHGTSA